MSTHIASRSTGSTVHRCWQGVHSFAVRCLPWRGAQRGHRPQGMEWHPALTTPAAQRWVDGRHGKEGCIPTTLFWGDGRALCLSKEGVLSGEGWPSCHAQLPRPSFPSTQFFEKAQCPRLCLPLPTPSLHAASNGKSETLLSGLLG